METVTPLAEVKEKALDTALRLVMHNGYGGSEDKALVRLKRRCPGRTKAECQVWLQRAVMVYRDCIEFLDENTAAAHATFSLKSKTHDLLNLATPIRKKYSDFPAKSLEGVLSLVFYFYHLR